MNQVNARHEIIREWRSLPKELRQTDEQAAAFAMQIKDKYKFSSDSADPYQTVKDWLLRYLSITRGLERNAEGEGKMSGDDRSTDPGISAVERKTLRSREAEETIAEHESAQRAFHENRERLREERLRREPAAGPMLIRPQSFQTTPSSRTSDLLPGYGNFLGYRPGAAPGRPQQNYPLASNRAAMSPASHNTPPAPAIFPRKVDFSCFGYHPDLESRLTL